MDMNIRIFNDDDFMEIFDFLLNVHHHFSDTKDAE